MEGMDMADLVSWDPFREIRSIQDRFSRALGTSGRRERDEEMSLGAWLPPVDIAEDKDKITLTAELPGFSEDQVQLNMEGNILTIRGERKFEEEKGAEGRNYHRVERAYGQFVRSFTLPPNVDREHIEARFRNGLLEIDLPKREETKPRQIRIAGESAPPKKGHAIDVQSR
jgi:HSP20 family protein